MEVYMKRGGRHINIIGFLLLLSMFAGAQVSVRSNIDRNAILIGESIALTVEAYMPLGSNVTWIGSDTIPHFDIILRGRIDTLQGIDGKKMSQSFTLTSFDSGQLYIPPFEMSIDGQFYYTDSIPVMVSFAPFDPKDDYRDIKDIVQIENPSAKFIPWFVLALAAVMLGLLIFGLYTLQKKTGKPIKAPEPLLSAYEEAMKLLNQLASRYSNNGEIKTYYSDMNDVLRRYVSRKFTMSTFQKTNEELILELAGLGIPRDAFVSLAQSLRMSDSVKFAKYRPTDEDNRNNLQIVRSSIEILDKNEVASAV